MPDCWCRVKVSAALRLSAPPAPTILGKPKLKVRTRQTSSSWTERIDHTGMPYVAVVFSERDCKSCPARTLCTRKAKGARRLKLQPQAQYLALQQARQRHASEEGRLLYNRRAGIEGTISQGVRAFELRQTRYRGLAKAHLQHIAIAAAINLDRIVAWLEEIPRALTRTSRFAALKPA